MDNNWHKRTGYKMAEHRGYDGEKFSPLCFQRQLRDSKDTGERLGLDNAVVKEISFNEAQDFILKYEWLGSMGVTQFSFGFYIDDILTSVLCFGVTSGSESFSEPFGAENKHLGIVLVRGACAPWAHQHTASYFLGKVFPLVREKGYRFIIAYSDPEAGEIGTVYQATNWYFYGLTCPRQHMVRPDGKRVDPRLIYKYAKKNNITRQEQKKIFIDEGYVFAKGHQKLKYLILLGNKREKKELLSKTKVRFYPYLKRQDNMRNVYEEFNKNKPR